MNKLVSIIKILALNYREIVIDIELSFFTINSIELGDNDSVILHVFKDDMDIEFLYDDISIEDKKKIFNTLSSFLYN